MRVSHLIVVSEHNCTCCCGPMWKGVTTAITSYYVTRQTQQQISQQLPPGKRVNWIFLHSTNNAEVIFALLLLFEMTTQFNTHKTENKTFFQGELLYGYGGREVYQYSIFKPLEGYFWHQMTKLGHYDSQNILRNIIETL